MTIEERLEDLIRQAEEDRSHNYVAATAKAALYEIRRLRDEKFDLVNYLAGISRQTGAMAKSYGSTSSSGDESGSRRPAKKR